MESACISPSARNLSLKNYTLCWSNVSREENKVHSVAKTINFVAIFPVVKLKKIQIRKKSRSWNIKTISKNNVKKRLQSCSIKKEFVCIHLLHVNTKCQAQKYPQLLITTWPTCEYLVRHKYIQSRLSF